MWKIKIEFLTETNVWKQAVYDSFSIGPKQDDYRLHVSGYNPSISTAGNNIYKYRLHVLGYNPNISTTGNTTYKYRLHVHGYNPNISTVGNTT